MAQVRRKIPAIGKIGAGASLFPLRLTSAHPFAKSAKKAQRGGHPAELAFESFLYRLRTHSEGYVAHERAAGSAYPNFARSSSSWHGSDHERRPLHLKNSRGAIKRYAGRPRQIRSKDLDLRAHLGRNRDRFDEWRQPHRKLEEGTTVVAPTII